MLFIQVSTFAILPRRYRTFTSVMVLQQYTQHPPVRWAEETLAPLRRKLFFFSVHIGQTCCRSPSAATLDHPITLTTGSHLRLYEYRALGSAPPHPADCSNFAKLISRAFRRESTEHTENYRSARIRMPLVTSWTLRRNMYVCIYNMHVYNNIGGNFWTHRRLRSNYFFI